MMNTNNALLLRNGRVFQHKSEGTGKTATFHSCLLVKGDIIEHVGSEEDEPIKAALSQGGGGGGGVQTRDLQGSTVLPGFIDGHIHLLMLGQALHKVDLAGCASFADIRAAIASYASANPSAPRSWTPSTRGPSSSTPRTCTRCGAARRRSRSC